MVNVRRGSCLQASCSRIPSFNVEGTKTPMYCKQHAEDGMVDILGRRCSRGSCTRVPSFNVKGSKKASYCNQHAGDDMVDVRTKRCSYSSCIKRPGWVLLTDGAATTFIRHKSNLSGALVINVCAKCKVVGCGKVSRWGLTGKQRTCCPDHGPFVDVACTVGAARIKASRHSRSYNAVRRPSFRLKTECIF